MLHSVDVLQLPMEYGTTSHWNADNYSTTSIGMQMILLAISIQT